MNMNVNEWMDEWMTNYWYAHQLLIHCSIIAAVPILSLELGRYTDPALSSWAPLERVSSDNGLISLTSHPLSWVTETRYLGGLKVSIFPMPTQYAKRSYFSAVNGIFGKLLNVASEVVILELIKSKCIPILLYELECCQLNNTNLQSLDFTFNRLFMKLCSSPYQ